jgi:hypothetical protein
MSTSDSQELIQELAKDLARCRQNRLLSEGEFIRFCKKREIPVWGVVTGDPSLLQNRGLLREDSRREDGSPLYHPFRFYIIYVILESLRNPLSRSSYLDRERVLPTLERIVREWLPSDQEISARAAQASEIVELAILLEPLYWRYVTGVIVNSVCTMEGKLDYTNYSKVVKQYVKKLCPDQWKARHDILRRKAANIDDNGSLYLLLRLSSWEQRQKLTGRISLALWIRHIAEMIRLAFEEIHEVKWDEEDWAYGHWFEDGRRLTYGFERPLDQPDEAQSRLAFLFRLATGSSIRWYVEGETEFYAISKLIPNPSREGIELVNLKGNIATGKDNIAMKLAEALAQDKEQRRFSMISFDADVEANVKLIRKQVSEDRVIGCIAANTPDFEFANFSLEELVKIACRIEEHYGFASQSLLEGDWKGIATGKEFEKRYCSLSKRRPRGLKGSEWGCFLAEYAMEYPVRSDNGQERPVISQVYIGLAARTFHYDSSKESLCFDEESFQLMKKGDKQQQDNLEV